MLRIILTIASVFILCLANVSCDDSNAGASAQGGKFKMVYIAKNSGNAYFDTVSSGFAKAAQENDVGYYMVAPDTADATSQIALIQQQVANGVKVLAITPNSPDAVAPALREAMKKGVTVVTVDSDLTGNEDARNASVLAVDPQAVGAAQIELMGSLMYYRGTFAILSATPDAPNQNSWIAAMKKTLAEDPQYKQMQLVDVVYGNDNLQKSIDVCNELVKKYPDLNGILSPTTVGLAGAAQSLDYLGKAQQIKLTGLGLPSEMREYVTNRVVRKFQLWQPADEGYLCGTLACQIATGAVKPAPGVKIEAGSLGDRVIGDHNIVTTDRLITFTPGNIGNFVF